MSEYKVSLEEGLKTLRSQEKVIYDAIGCPDLVASIDVKWAKELNGFQRRKKENRTEEMESRLSEASRHIRGFMLASNPESADAFLRRLMLTRCERNLLAERGLDLADAMDRILEENEIPHSSLPASFRILLQSMREAGSWDEEGEQG